ncbi:MAG: GAF domain-containing protein [Flammeovirgaceae bacterium]
MKEDILTSLCEFPFEISLSISPLIEYWQQAHINGSKAEKILATSILQQLEEAPELMEDRLSESIIDQHQDLINMMMTAIFPSATMDDDIGAAITPYSQFTPFLTSKFEQLFGKNWERYDKKAVVEDKHEEMIYRKTLHAYIMIFKEFYGIELPLDKTIVMNLPDQNTGLDRHFKLEINMKFAKINRLKAPKALTDAQLDELIQNSHKLELWMKYLPPEDFEFSGFCVFKFNDVTTPEILSQLKFDLLDKESLVVQHKFESLQHKLRSMFKIPELRLGVSGFDQQRAAFVSFGKASHSLILGDSEKKMACSRVLGLYDCMVNKGEPYIINDLKEHIDKNPYWKNLVTIAGIQNMVMAPLHYDGEFIGVLELAAPKPGQLSSSYLLQIQDIIPLFSIALNRNAEERESNIDAIIKKQYTAIHPAVEWRFEQAASRYLEQKERGEIPEAEQIVFNEVYPLYAAIDIRGSSTERNKAIQADLIEHLTLTHELISKAKSIKPLPIFNNLSYKIQKHIQNIEEGLFSGDEMGVIEFLQQEVDPCFETLEQIMPNEIGADLAAYRAKIDPELSVIYNKRKEFERSLTRINEVLSEYIESQEEIAQQMFPHYFEKYKTDGVEYNIYIGDSMANNRTFNQMYLKNIRLWQLESTITATRKAHHLIPELSLPLATTQLILVHSNALSIRFRLDERQFDVDGAYNIRYEIVKKRIDKALIKGTNERLTQPEKIAIVYSQGKDAEEYREYIEYLQSTGDLIGEIEDVELESLQGVQGLRALRVRVNLAKAEALPTETNEARVIELAKAV